MIFLSSTTGPLLSHAFWTLGVLALMGGLAWLVVRFGTPRLNQYRGNRRMKVLERLALEPRRSLYMVEIDGKTTVFYVGDGKIAPLPIPFLPPAEIPDSGDTAP